MIGEYAKFDDEPDPNNVLNEGVRTENVRYIRLVEQAEQELLSVPKFSKLSFLLHIFRLKSMHGWLIKSFDMSLELLSTVFSQINLFPSS